LLIRDGGKGKGLVVVVILKLQFDVYEFVRAMQFTRQKKNKRSPWSSFWLGVLSYGGTSQTGKNGLGK
jgi:hypothetical protein